VSSGRTVDSHVRALRRKLGPDIVRTVHGVGYAVAEPPAPGTGSPAPGTGSPAPGTDTPTPGETGTEPA
jgi:hypothetical protein